LRREGVERGRAGTDLHLHPHPHPQGKRLCRLTGSQSKSLEEKVDGWLFFSHLTNRMLLVESGTGNRGPVSGSSSSSSNVLAVVDRVADRLSGARLEQAFLAPLNHERTRRWPNDLPSLTSMIYMVKRVSRAEKRHR
jgi:hypothetical protein